MHRAGSPQRRLASWSLAAAALLSACGGAAVGESATVGGDVSNTVDGVGLLPGANTPAEVPAALALDDEILANVSLPPLEAEEIGATAAGNRVLLVGDSLFAGLAPRYSNLACQGLNPLGWQVLVEAEPGRFAEFGKTVLNRRLAEGWDAVVLNFGTNYRGNRDAYTTTMAEMLADIGDIPVVLLTTTMFREQQREVNEVINGFGTLFPNVTVVDWEAISALPGMISRDRIHPTDNGRKIMVAAIAQVLGLAPPDTETPATCLRSTFTDDSAVGRGSLSIATSIPSNGSGSGSGGSATTTPSNSPTVPTGTSPGGTTPGATTPTTSPSGTNPPGTNPPGTNPPGTNPPGMNPPGTNPPGTNPPGTNPPGTNPPGTNPPATSPPATSPPATSPPATNPPATSPPATSPPATSPPVSEQSATG